MAATAPRRDERQEAPPVDPVAVPRRLATERARRAAREDHEISVKRAQIRFWLLIGVLVFAGAILTLTIWDQIQSLFGLSP
jgi:hypothetical protein